MNNGNLKKTHIEIATTENDYIIFENKNEFLKFYKDFNLKKIRLIHIDNIKQRQTDISKYIMKIEPLFIIKDNDFDDTCPIYKNSSGVYPNNSSTSDKDKAWKYTEEEANFLIQNSPRSYNYKKISSSILISLIFKAFYLI